MSFHRGILQIDAASEAERIATVIRGHVLGSWSRRGAVVGVSGGVDSATVLALAARALGPERVLALVLPDRDSNPDSEVLARQAAARYGVAVVKADVSAALEALGCYERRDAAVREIFPDYASCERIKIVLPGDLLERGGLNVYSVVRERPGVGEERRLLSASAYLGIVAASNMKQRVRMLTLYYHAERHNYAVIGTANKDEYGQGFFVKYGDGGADLQPIQHLYKSQVYQLARYLGVPQQIVERTPTTDTYSAGCSQEEFYFRLPFDLLDLIWYALEHEVPADEAAEALGLKEQQVVNVYRDLAQKRRATEYLRAAPVSLSPAPEALQQYEENGCGH